MGSGCQDAMWIGKVLKFIFGHEMSIPIVYTVNKSGVTLTEYDDFYRRIRHIRRRYHFIREYIEEWDVVVA